MNKYKLTKYINYVIIDDSVIVLDFKSGEFYLLDNEYLSIFQTIDKYGNDCFFNENNIDKTLLAELLDNDIFKKIN